MDRIRTWGGALAWSLASALCAAASGFVGVLAVVVANAFGTQTHRYPSSHLRAAQSAAAVIAVAWAVGVFLAERRGRTVGCQACLAALTLPGLLIGTALYLLRP